MAKGKVQAVVLASELLLTTGASAGLFPPVNGLNPSRAVGSFVVVP